MRGPAVVVGRTNKQVFVKHGGFIVRLNPVNIEPVESESSAENSISADLESDHSFSESESESDDEAQSTSHPVDEEALFVPAQRSKASSSTPLAHRHVINGFIRYQCREGGAFTRAKVLSRAGKASGPLKHWYNVHDCDSNQDKSIDLSTVYNWENCVEESGETTDTGVPDALEVTEVLLVNDCSEILKAKQKELENLASRSQINI